MLSHRAIREGGIERDPGATCLPRRPHTRRDQARLIRLGFPVDDRGGYVDGDPLAIELRETTSAAPFGLRDYQANAADAFHASGTALGGPASSSFHAELEDRHGHGGHAVVGAKTLILTTNTVAVRQWRDELLDKTTLTEDEGEYTGDVKDLKPVTVSTYQMLTLRRSKSTSSNTSRSSARRTGARGLRRVHLLPAPIFRVTAELRRAGGSA